MKRTKNTAAKSLSLTTMRSPARKEHHSSRKCSSGFGDALSGRPTNLVRHGIETAMAEFPKASAGRVSFNRYGRSCVRLRPSRELAATSRWSTQPGNKASKQ
jgi:hypothetical protein